MIEPDAEPEQTEGTHQTGASLPDADEGVAAADPPPILVNPDSGQRSQMNEIALEIAKIKRDKAKDDRDLRKVIATRVLWAVAIQVGIADAVFLTYAVENDWMIEDSIQAWLAAAVVQVIALALVIVRSLFPERRRK